MLTTKFRQASRYRFVRFASVDLCVRATKRTGVRLDSLDQLERGAALGLARAPTDWTVFAYPRQFAVQRRYSGLAHRTQHERFTGTSKDGTSPHPTTTSARTLLEARARFGRVPVRALPWAGTVRTATPAVRWRGDAEARAVPQAGALPLAVAGSRCSRRGQRPHGSDDGGECENGSQVHWISPLLFPPAIPRSPPKRHIACKYEIRPSSRISQCYFGDATLTVSCKNRL